MSLANIKATIAYTLVLMAKKTSEQDYAEEERSGTDGTYWMDRGIQAALDLNARNVSKQTRLFCLDITAMTLSVCDDSIKPGEALPFDVTQDVNHVSARNI